MQTKILILDDDDAVRESFACYFEDRGWGVITAASAEDALDILHTCSPLAAIVDIRLGGMNGDEFIRRASQLNTDMGFVICTGSPDFELHPDLMGHRQVAETIFLKPVFDLGTLFNAVNNICGKRQERK